MFKSNPSWWNTSKKEFKQVKKSFHNVIDKSDWEQVVSDFRQHFAQNYLVYYRKHNPDAVLTQKEARSARKAKVYPDVEFVIHWDRRKELGAVDLDEARHVKLTSQQARQWSEIALSTNDISHDDLVYWYHMAMLHSSGDSFLTVCTLEKFTQRLGGSTFHDVELPQLPVRLEEVE